MTALQATAGGKPSFLDIARKTGNNIRFLEWADWCERWNRATDIPVLEGLLHCGFKTDVRTPEEEIERLRTFLNLAEGHGSSKSLSSVESAVASKAFKVLAEKLSGVLNDRLPVMPPEAVEAVLKFFRPKETMLSEGGGLQNFPRIPNEDDKSRYFPLWKMGQTCLDWCRWVWEIDHYGAYCTPVGPWPKNEATLQALKDARPKVLEILYAFKRGQLERLLDMTQALDGEGGNQHLVTRVQWELFTPDCLEKLRELALRSGPTIPWALVAGSSAAKVFLDVRVAHSFQRKHKKANKQ